MSDLSRLAGVMTTAELEWDSRLRAAGFEVVHFTWQDITRAPDKVMAKIKTAFRRGAAS